MVSLAVTVVAGTVLPSTVTYLPDGPPLVGTVLEVPATSLPDDDLSRLVARARTPLRDLDRLPAMSAFLRRVEAFPELDVETQLRLVATVRDGEAAAERLAGGGNSSRHRRLAQKVRDGERAAEALVGANFRLVLLICREKATERLGAQRALDLLPELLAEANVALTEAIRTFDPDLSPSFATFAARKVRDRVVACLNDLGGLRVASSWSRLRRVAAVRIPELTTRLGRAPTKDEIKADLLDTCLAWAEAKLSPEQAALAEPHRHEAKMARLRKQGMLAAIESIDDVIITGRQFSSLDAPASADGDATLGDLVADSDVDTDGGFTQVERNELNRDLMAAIAHLTPREQRIVLCRYGFVDGEQWTYPRIATEFTITPERIRQIEKVVLERLRDGGFGLEHHR